MTFPDHPYPEGTLPYPPQAEVLKYLHSYADRFDLKKHIELSHHVIRVLPIEDKKWEVIVKNCPTEAYETKTFDVVLVCNGHHVAPRIPEIDGAEEFQGKFVHAHDFRTEDIYKGSYS